MSLRDDRAGRLGWRVTAHPAMPCSVRGWRRRVATGAEQAGLVNMPSAGEEEVGVGTGKGQRPTVSHPEGSSVPSLAKP